MTTHHGKDGVCKVGANNVGELVSWSTTESIDIVDDGVIGDTAKTHLTGRTEWSASIRVRWDNDDTAQSAMTIGASVSLSFYPEGEASGDQFKTGTGTVTKVGESVELDGVVERSYSITGNGALTQDSVS